jgi:hypothetical protein
MTENKKLEAHSITSLAHRLKLLVSRATIRGWIKEGKLKPSAIQDGDSKYLIFQTDRINGLLAQLEKAFKERLGRLAKNDPEALAFKAQAEALALARITANRKRSKNGKTLVRESSPALNDDDARGVQRLTVQDKPQKICSGFGINK